MDKSLRIDFYVLLAIIFISIPIIIYFQVKPLTSALLFFVVPTIYLFLRKKKPIKEVFCGSLLIGGSFGFIFDIFATINNAWYVPSEQLVFKFRIFGFWPVDEVIWFILWALSILVFYEHFYERDRKDKLSRRFKYIFIPASFTFIIVLLFSYVSRDFLLFPYAYSTSVSLPILMIIIFLIKKRPNLLIKFIKTGAFFFMLYLIHELTAMKLGQWYFPGQYIGWVNLFGLEFPFEELLFWMGLSPAVVLTLYESFVDNDK